MHFLTAMHLHPIDALEVHDGDRVPLNKPRRCHSVLVGTIEVAMAVSATRAGVRGK